MGNFDLYMPVRLITGRGCVRKNAGQLTRWGKKCLVVTSGTAAKKSGALDDVLAVLEEGKVPHLLYDRISQNPLLTDCVEAGALAREFGAEFVVGIGGGSALDAAKAAAVFAANDLPPLDVFRGDWERPALPLVLIGTTAGTGSEVAPFSVLTKPDGRKQSISSEQIYARVAFGDGGYTDSLPWSFTVSTALDALSHGAEAYFSTQANDMSDLYALEAVRILWQELPAFRRPDQDLAAISPETRDRLYQASVLAGLALARCGTCYCHSLGYFLTEEHDVPHGFACAATLPDYLARAGRLMPEKAARLYRHAACRQEELIPLIQALTQLPPVTLNAEEVLEIVDRYDGNKNFQHTAPTGYTRREAIDLLTEVFGG